MDRFVDLITLVSLLFGCSFGTQQGSQHPQAERPLAQQQVAQQAAN